MDSDIKDLRLSIRYIRLDLKEHTETIEKLQKEVKRLNRKITNPEKELNENMSMMERQDYLAKIKYEENDR